MNRKNIFRFLRWFLLIYAVIGICIYYLQDYIMFHPQPLPKDHTFNFTYPFREVNIPYSAASVMNVIEFTTTGKPKGVVLYFHGNRENIERYATYAPKFTRQGYEVWMMDYPGYGKSTGTFSEQGLYDWALTLYKLARARYSPDSIIIYGKSMGTGIAAQLASIRDTRHLVLESPYYSFPSILDSWLPIYPSSKIIKYKFPTYEYLKKVTAPILIFEGTDDWTVPPRNAKRLIPLLKKNDEFILIPGAGHNDIPEFTEYRKKINEVCQ